MKIGAILLLLLIIPMVYAGSVMTIEANILASAPDEEIISIQVPDYVFLGNVTKGQISDEIKVTVNNTGNVDIIVTPTLVNLSEDIFNYTQFRSTKTKTVNGTSIDVPFTKIGDFNFEISESGHEYFYISLNLMNYSREISQDMVGRRADIKFVAMKT